MEPQTTEANLPDETKQPEDSEKDLIKEKIKKALKNLSDYAAKEDQTVRERKIREYRQLMLLWEGFTNVYWNESASDFRLPTNEDLNDDEEIPRNINIYRPYGESVIAALATLVPGIIFFPDDAESPEDIEAADAYKRIVELISRHNDGKLLFVKALVILFNQGVICGYNYIREDPKYGSVRNYQIGYEDKQVQTLVCPNCGTELESPEPTMCPGCGQLTQPQMVNTTESVPKIVGYDDIPKARSTVELHGPLFVKMSYFAKKQEDLGYIQMDFEQADAMLKATFPESAHLIKGTNDTQSYERWSRLDSVYLGESPRNLATVRCNWFRPWFYWNLENKEDIELLNITFPNGVYCVQVNDFIVDFYDENMDDHWTISFNPLSEFIHSMPLGKNVAVIQDIRNDVVDIQVQTAEFGIPETFADPKTLDFDKFGETRAKVGMYTQAKAQPGKSLQESFFSTVPARLAPEVKDLKLDLDQDAQFTLGAYPSVYGGAQLEGSKTAHEYEQSRAMALQRLGLSYQITAIFWSKLMSRAATEFAGYIRENGDEQFVVKSGSQFINNWVMRSSLLGKIGHVEPEFSDQLPLTWSQKKDTLLQMMELNSPSLNAVMLHPRNIDLMKRAIGITEIYVPGDEARTKQLEEFYQLIQEEPVQGMDGQLAPSIDIDPDIDDDAVEMETIKSMLIGPIGRAVKQSNPAGYVNAVLHYKRHELNFAVKTIKPSGDSIPGEKPEVT